MAKANATSTTGEKKVALIKDYRMLRLKLKLNQTEFWNRIGATQSAGCRYESGRNPPKAVAVLAHRVYIRGEEIDVRGYK